MTAGRDRDLPEALDAFTAYDLRANGKGSGSLPRRYPEKKGPTGLLNNTEKREGGFLLSFLLPLLYEGKSASSLNVYRLETLRRTKDMGARIQEQRFCNDLN